MTATPEPVSYLVQAPLTPPVPVPGCVTCTDLAKRRAQAAAEGDGSRVSDCNIRMRRHHRPPIST